MSTDDEPSINALTAKFPLIEEWSDDETMEAFFSYFGNNEAISKEYLHFWQTAILWTCFGYSCEYTKMQRKLRIKATHSPSFCISPNEVPLRFKRLGVVPDMQGITKVLEKLDEQSIIRPERIFHNDARMAQRTSQWIFHNVVYRPVAFLWESFQSAAFDPDPNRSTILPSLDYVALNVLEDAANRIYLFAGHLPKWNRVFCLPNHLHSHCAQRDDADDLEILSLQSLCRRCGRELQENSETIGRLLRDMSSKDVTLLAHHMIITKRGTIRGQLLKLVYKSETSQKEFTEEDSAMSLLQHTIMNIKYESAVLEQRMIDARKAALEKKRLGQTREAMQHFKQYKKCEKNLDDRRASMHNLQETFDKIQNMHHNRQMHDAMKLAVNTLKRTRENADLSIDRIQETMDAWKECVEEANVIESSLTSWGVDFDEAELENELQGLLQSDRGPEPLSSMDNMHALLDALPEAPTATLSCHTTKDEKQMQRQRL